MPKELKIRRFAKLPYRTSAQNSNNLSTNTAIRSVRNGFYGSISNISSYRTGMSEYTHSSHQRPRVPTRCSLPITSPLREECSGERSLEIVANQKASIPDQKNNLLSLFNKEHLKVFNRNLLDVMYRDKQCSNCGERFKSEYIDKHLDMHFKVNSDRRRIYKPCRLYYGTTQDFLSEITDAVPVSFATNDNKKALRKCVTTKSGLLATSIIDMCHGCHESISQFFNDEDEEWQLENAIKMDGNIYHRICARSVH